MGVAVGKSDLVTDLSQALGCLLSPVLQALLPTSFLCFSHVGTTAHSFPISAMKAEHLLNTLVQAIPVERFWALHCTAGLLTFHKFNERACYTVSLSNRALQASLTHTARHTNTSCSEHQCWASAGTKGQAPDKSDKYPTTVPASVSTFSTLPGHSASSGTGQKVAGCNMPQHFPNCNTIECSKPAALPS